MSVVSRAVVSLALLALVAPARADEEKVALKDLPRAVMDTVKARFPGAELTGASKETEEGKTIFEVTLKDRGQNVDASLLADGRLIEVEREIAAGALPGAVATAVKAKYPDGTIKKAESIATYEGGKETTNFEVLLTRPGKKDVEVKLSPEGKVLNEEEGDEAGK